MAMTKKEKEYLEQLLTDCSLRTTYEVLPDVPAPESFHGLSVGYIPVAMQSDSARVEEACSNRIHHGVGSQLKTSSQGSIELYSTRLLALKALRRGVEKDSAKRLRKIDKMIEAEELKSE